MFNRPHYYSPELFRSTREVTSADLFIYGATSGGIAAAVEAARQGLRVVVADLANRVGGLTASGLGSTDFGNKQAIGGLSLEFYRQIGAHYGKEVNWTFEPHVAEMVFLDWIKQHHVQIHYYKALQSVEKQGNQLRRVIMEDGHVFEAKMFVDATYEGDLMAMAGVSYHVGRESTQTYGELYNGVHFGHPNHNFVVAVDPYVKRGNRHSGLLPEISPSFPGGQGDGDRRIQAYNFRFCLTAESRNRVSFPKPACYNPDRYELLARYIDAGIFDALNLSIAMPNGKTDTNNFGAFSTDYIGGNYGWPEGSYAQREAIFQAHVDYMSGLFYFLSHEQRVPKSVRKMVCEYGLCADEFDLTGHWPHQLYVREARRMVSDVIATEHHCLGAERVEDSVGLAAYGMDSHNCQRVAYEGRALNEGNVEILGAGPYPISYRSIIPKEKECSNLLVPWALSASHIAFGSIRMEPVFMVLGQSAAIAAGLALVDKCPLQQLPYETLRQALVQAGQVLDWPGAAKLNPVHADQPEMIEV